MNNPSRNVKIDILKCIASLCVIIGHSIQYSGLEYESKLFNGLFLVIYSFHMPLFAVISGFLLRISIENKGVTNAIVKRLFIIFPLVLYSIPTFVSYHIYSVNDSAYKNLKHFVGYIFRGNGVIWFLPTILACSIILSVASCFKHCNKIIILIFLLSFVAIHDYGLALFSFIFCFSAVGYFFAQYKESIKMPEYGYIICLGMYLVSLLFWKKEYLIYNGCWSVIGSKNPFIQICIDFFRIFIGILGNIVAYYIVSKIITSYAPRKSIVYIIGSNTLGIYCISNLVFEYVPQLLRINNVYEMFVILLFFAVFLSVGAVMLMKKSKVTKILFLGHR